MSGPAAIVGPGPSFDDFPREALERLPVVALNAAITEVWKGPGRVWACHDIHKIWRDRFEERIRGYRDWTLLARRVALPGKIGDGPYRAVGGGVERGPFAPRLATERLRACAEVRWYSELPDQSGYLLARETVLEIALEALTLWGARPIVLVGVDMGPGAGYARPWKWKRCLIRPPKFAAMRQALIEGRARWPEDVLVAGTGWKGCPFDVVTAEEGARVLSPAGAAP